MLSATITSDGQVTLPKAIQQLLNLQPGDQLDFVIQPDGNVYIKRIDVDVRELSGMLYRPKRQAVSLEDMEAAVVKGAQESM